MKTLFIRNAGRFSGSETYDVNLFQELQNDFSLKIYFLTNLRILAKRVSDFNITTRIIPWGEEGVGTKKQLLVTIFKLPISIVCYLSIIRKLEKGDRFDLICLQSMTEKIFLTPVLKAYKYNVVWTELGPLYATQMSKVVTFLYKLASLYVDRIFTISKDTKRDLVSGGVAKDKVETVYIGINTNQYKPLRKSYCNMFRKQNAINNSDTVIGFLGTVTKEKGIEDFIAISSLLNNNLKGFHFVVIGDGPSLSWVKRSIRSLKMTSSYTYTGFVQNVKSYLGIIDILLLPTKHYEGLPLAILEAQSMGKVVITSNMGGNSEIIINGKNGYIYTRMNRKIITKLIENLASNKSKMVALGTAARLNIITRFNIQTQAKKFVEVLKYYDHRG